jgi:hypothetical protein
MANRLTVREAGSRRVLAEPYVGARTAMFRPRRGAVRGFLGTDLQPWIGGRLEEIALAGGDQEAFLSTEVEVADEGRY